MAPSSLFRIALKGCGASAVAEPTVTRIVGALADQPPIIYQCSITGGSARFDARGSTGSAMV